MSDQQDLGEPLPPERLGLQVSVAHARGISERRHQHRPSSGDHRASSPIKTAKEYLVAFSGENTERGIFCRRRVISIDVLEVEDLCVELKSLSEPAAPDLRNDGHLAPILAGGNR